MRKNNNKSDTLPKLSLEEEILKTSETLSLTDLIIHDYEKTNDDTKLRAYAAVFEQQMNQISDAFRLYERIGDENGIQRAAKRYFVRGLLLSRGEELVKKSGLELTPDLYNERGDYQLSKKDFDNALEAYQKIGNVERVNLVLQTVAEQ